MLVDIGRGGLGFESNVFFPRGAVIDVSVSDPDGLIELLKSEEYGGGQSMWDRTLIYIASDFDRSKTRPSNADDFGSGHDLNGGALMISPLVRGNSVLGGVDPDTGLTYGFDPQTGEPEPGRHMTEAEIYAGVVQALGADTSGSGLPDMPAMRRS
ncbi:MAG: hypothetical protein Tsb0020_53050 [Haliangiales bacterium]